MGECEAHWRAQRLIRGKIRATAGLTFVTVEARDVIIVTMGEHGDIHLSDPHPAP
jgi:hypothetical protein